MRIVEAGDDRPAPGVDGDGLRTLHPQDLAIAADLQNLVAADRDRLRQIGFDLAGENNRVVDDQVHQSVIVTLGADNEAGNDGQAHDADNDEGGESCGHKARILTCAACYSPRHAGTDSVGPSVG